MILQNDFKRQWETVAPAVRSAIERVGVSGWFILGKEVDRFEKTLAQTWGVAHVVGVGNGMDALEIGLRCLGLKPGQKVLTTPLSAFASTLAIVRAGGMPVFVDVDGTGSVDLAQCRDALARDRSIRFLLPVHLYGNALDLEALAALRRDFELTVVEDCAQAIGATRNGRKAGTVGQVAGTSLYPTKNLGALGDGGALLTDDPALAEKARVLRNYGQSALYHHSDLGLNSRLDELHAAILCDALLPNLEKWTARRKRIAAAYQAGLHHPAIRILPAAADAGAVWHLFPVMVEGQRDRLQEYLRARNISTGVHYPRIIPDQKALQSDSAYECLTELSTARRFAECELSLPIHPFLTDDEVETIIRCCNEWPLDQAGEY